LRLFAKGMTLLAVRLIFLLALAYTTISKTEMSQNFQNKCKENKPSFSLQTNI